MFVLTAELMPTANLEVCGGEILMVILSAVQVGCVYQLVIATNSVSTEIQPNLTA